MSGKDVRNRFLTHLADSSSDCFRRAVHAYVQEDFHDFYLHSGIALEHLLKSRLVAISPTLIADPRQFSTLLILAQLPKDRLPVPLVRMIGVAERFSAMPVALLIAGLAAYTDRLKLLVNYRNGDGD
ncbi:hypothetical protein [Micromonospora echinospora]